MRKPSDLTGHDDVSHVSLKLVMSLRSTYSNSNKEIFVIEDVDGASAISLSRNSRGEGYALYKLRLI